MIAAIALQHNLTLATGNIAHYQRIQALGYSLKADRRGQGIGKLLLPPLIGAARAKGLHAIIAGIDAEGEASIRLHEAFGFQRVGHLKEVGYKFGRWLDVIYMELLL
jgi:phosphinothricin acetyltransferase